MGWLRVGPPPKAKTTGERCEVGEAKGVWANGNLTAWSGRVTARALNTGRVRPDPYLEEVDV